MCSLASAILVITTGKENKFVSSTKDTNDTLYICTTILHQHAHGTAIPVQNAPCTHGLQSATEALSTLPNVPTGQLQLVKATLSARDTDGEGHTAGALDPAAQKLPALQGKDVSEFPGQYLPAGQITPPSTPPPHVKPCGHCWHVEMEVWPTPVEYLPAGHAKHWLRVVVSVTSP